MVKCGICGKEVKTPQALTGHLRLAHKIKDSSGEHSAVSTQHSGPLNDDAELAVLKHEVKVAEYQAELTKFKAVNEKWEVRFTKVENELMVLKSLILSSVDTALGQAMSHAIGQVDWHHPEGFIAEYASSFAENIEKTVRARYQ
ncbi:hypothetical protein Dform_00816 [Dehalogenimonas formicexedens]|uniref:C2H2-type domain-containing protein n=1 Tax=Dehalogenimonas formicexedens TaxID=1839801 RepID=A0A1P8F6Q9_9CHLR|nr:hypothetical protein [Dehalogenimonas formicexedens]APV44164.1 hypothetical protein Dform_00816 [Dehalogenimonas formicexedens]